MEDIRFHGVVDRGGECALSVEYLADCVWVSGFSGQWDGEAVTTVPAVGDVVVQNPVLLTGQSTVLEGMYVVTGVFGDDVEVCPVVGYEVTEEFSVSDLVVLSGLGVEDGDQW